MATRLVSTISGMLLFAHGLRAQTSRASDVIDGLVTDTNLVALADAVVSIRGSNIRVTTGATGRFRIAGVVAGEFTLVVGRVGFLTSATMVQVAANDTVQLAFELKPGIDPVEPTAAPLSVVAGDVPCVDVREPSRVSLAEPW